MLMLATLTVEISYLAFVIGKVIREYWRDYKGVKSNSQTFLEPKILRNSSMVGQDSFQSQNISDLHQNLDDTDIELY